MVTKFLHVLLESVHTYVSTISICISVCSLSIFSLPPSLLPLSHVCKFCVCASVCVVNMCVYVHVWCVYICVCKCVFVYVCAWCVWGRGSGIGVCLWLLHKNVQTVCWVCLFTTLLLKYSFQFNRLFLFIHCYEVCAPVYVKLGVVAPKYLIEMLISSSLALLLPNIVQTCVVGLQSSTEFIS